jgi:FXSXX-COOH protein
MHEDDSLLRSDLVDLTSVDFGRLKELPESALAASLWRILQEAAEDAEPIAGFHSAPIAAHRIRERRNAGHPDPDGHQRSAAAEGDDGTDDRD